MTDSISNVALAIWDAEEVDVGEAGAEVMVDELEGSDAVFMVALGRSEPETEEANPKSESLELESVEVLLMVEVESELVVEDPIGPMEARAQSLSAVGKASQRCLSLKPRRSSSRPSEASLLLLKSGAAHLQSA